MAPRLLPKWRPAARGSAHGTGAPSAPRRGLSRDARPNKPLLALARRLSRDIAPGSSGSNAREIWVAMWLCHAPLRYREGSPGRREGLRGGRRGPRALWRGCRSGVAARVRVGLWDSGAFGAPVPSPISERAVSQILQGHS